MSDTEKTTSVGVTVAILKRIIERAGPNMVASMASDGLMPFENEDIPFDAISPSIVMEFGVPNETTGVDDMVRLTLNLAINPVEETDSNETTLDTEDEIRAYFESQEKSE